MPLCTLARDALLCNPYCWHPSLPPTKAIVVWQIPWIILVAARAVLRTANNSAALRCRCLLHGVHVAIHRLRQLRIYFICHGCDISQSQTDIQKSEFVPGGLPKHAAVVQDITFCGLVCGLAPMFPFGKTDQTKPFIACL